MDDTTQVCVIGGGPSGIYALKHCLEYGLSAIGYEQRSQLGGVWTGGDPTWSAVGEDGRLFPAVHDALTLNTSQYITTFSDFPIPEDLTPSLKGSSRRYLSASEFLRYFHRYAAVFGVTERYQLSTEVVRVRKVEGHSDRPWEVTVRQWRDGSQHEKKSRHQYVIIASGLYTKPYIPEFPGLDETPIKVIHSLNVRNTKEVYGGKRVLIVGGSISAGDAAQIAIESGAAKVTWALTRNAPERSFFVVDRYPRGEKYAWDEWSNLFKFTYFPMSFLMADLDKMSDMPHKKEPDAKINMVYDRMAIADLKVIREAQDRNQLEVYPVTLQSVSKDSNKAVLSNGRKIDVDVLIMATGCLKSYPFIDEDVLDSEGLAGLALYNHKVVTNKIGWGLSFVYTTTLVSGGFVPTEIEARWLAHYIANDRLLTENQRLDLAAQAENISNPFKAEVIREQFFDIMDKHAKDLRCRPQFWPALFSLSPWRRRVGLATVFGPFLPQMFRLRGPHACPEVAGNYMLKVTDILLGWKFKAIVLAVDLLHVGALVLVARGLYMALRGHHGAWPCRFWRG